MTNLLRTSLLRSLLKSSFKVPTRRVRLTPLLQVPERSNILVPRFRGFSTTCLRSLPAASIDKELSSKLADELKYEKENETLAPTPDFIKNFLSQNPFKAGKGALGFESLVTDGVFLINYVSYYHDAKLAGDWTAEADWKRRGYYPGPQFDTLDNDVQVLFEKYLEERGINTAVALFIPNYVEYKEQKEYVSWLENVKR
ncbi:14048_t:CDS:2 [Acaulospora colombiana]|uniref:14048_t:CDS:1 n=1 Tax=Acaulospora colombiana TaxID=27376 RepID=A0ACA9K0A0_9GLOM|nr:14048_t:CDS:2 [Acaulospora colombiana]